MVYYRIDYVCVDVGSYFFFKQKPAYEMRMSDCSSVVCSSVLMVIGFIPIGLAPSGVSEFSGDLFWVVGFALIASWFVVVLVIPYLGVKLLPDIPKHAGAHDAIYRTPRYERFQIGRAHV